MSIRMGDAAYRALARRYAELEALRLAVGERLMTEDELREWFSVNEQMTAIELAYPDGYYRPLGTGAMSGSIAAVADAESYEFELRWAGGYSAPELGA